MNIDKNYPIKNVDYELKSKEFAKQAAKMVMGQADRRKFNSKEIETLIWHCHLLGTMESLIQFLANAECFKSMTKDELLGEMQIFYIRQAKEFAKTSWKWFGKELTLESFMKEMAEIKFTVDNEGDHTFSWNGKIF